MSDCHGEPHRTATPSEEKARCNKAFCRLMTNRKTEPLCLPCAKIGGYQSDSPQKYKALQRNFGCLLAAPFKIL